MTYFTFYSTYIKLKTKQSIYSTRYDLRKSRLIRIVGPANFKQIERAGVWPESPGTCYIFMLDRLATRLRFRIIKVVHIYNLPWAKQIQVLFKKKDSFLHLFTIFCANFKQRYIIFTQFVINCHEHCYVFASL